jgi:hypothetical protein
MNAANVSGVEKHLAAKSADELYRRNNIFLKEPSAVLSGNG